MADNIGHIRRISVIGAGMMGHGIAQIFAVKGYAVTMQDIEKEILLNAFKRIRANLCLMAERNIFPEGEIEPALGRITLAGDLEAAASGAQFIVEAISENLESKQKMFHDLDLLCSEDTILATNTSVISITEIAGQAKRRGRIVGTHFWNPPYLVPLVEVIRGQETNEKAMDVTFDLLKEVGKHPVRINKDAPGFVGNRLQHALWREAISIVEQGIADAATVDECVKFGFGLRLPVLGPLENSDMVGLDLTLAIHDYILRHLECSPNPSMLLREKVKKGELGFKTGQGFRKWSDEEAMHSRETLMEHLLKWTRERRDD